MLISATHVALSFIGRFARCLVPHCQNPSLLHLHPGSPTIPVTQWLVIFTLVKEILRNYFLYQLLVRIQQLCSRHINKDHIYQSIYLRYSPYFTVTLVNTRKIEFSLIWTQPSFHLIQLLKKWYITPQDMLPSIFWMLEYLFNKSCIPWHIFFGNELAISF